MIILSPICRLTCSDTSHYSFWFWPDKANFKLFPRSHLVLRTPLTTERWHWVWQCETGYQSPGILGTSNQQRTEIVLVHKCCKSIDCLFLHVWGNVISPWNRERVRFDSFALLYADFPLPSSGILSLLRRFIVDNDMYNRSSWFWCFTGRFWY